MTRPIGESHDRNFSQDAQDAGSGFYYYTPSGQKVTPSATNSGGSTRQIHQWGDAQHDLAPMTQASFIQEYLFEGDQPPVTQEFSSEQYERVVNEMVEHGIVSDNGQTLVGAGVIGDFGDGLEVSPQTTVNNYAANNLTVNNDYSVIDAFDARARRTIDPV